MRRVAALVLMVAAGLSAAAPPPVMLWAWERPGDLRAAPANVGVAFLASTVVLDPGTVRVVPRRQSLRTEPNMFRMAVVRIEAHGPVSVATQLRPTVDAIADTVRITRATAIQLDFDALASQRAFYAALIRQVRAALGPKYWLSITALVSWCGAESWLDGLPVDEVVPMAFEMGDAGAAVQTLLRSGGQFENSTCRASIGLSLNDFSLNQASHRARGYRRIYLFAYREWSGDLVRSVMGQLQ
jgi:hypothetical protein